MATRRKSHPVVTLFAFQDVIMSVSGIIIVMVLLLTLELIQRPDSTDVSSPMAVVEQLQNELQRSAAAIREFEELLQANDAQIQNAAALSPADLRRQIERFSVENSQLEAETAALQAQLEGLRSHEHTLQIEAVENAEVVVQAAAARRTAEQLRDELESERRDNRPLFELPRGFNRQGWIAVISASEVTVAQLGRASRPRVFRGTGGFLGRSADSEFLEWAGTQKSTQLYWLLMVRPDGIEAYDRIAEALDNRRQPYGFDLVSSSQVLLHPERGAAE